MRLYHSTSLLLPDATVITMGGGTPGPETNLNAEIYYPPYLFDSDGNRRRGRRSASPPTAPLPGASLAIATPDAASIGRVSLVKIGSVTHSVDMDQRFLELPFTRRIDRRTATLPTNVNETPPGYYMVFVLNAAGVPSKSRIVRIGVAPALQPSGVNLVVNGGFEANAIGSGRAAHLRPVAGWANRGRPVELWRGASGLTARFGHSNAAIDQVGGGNRLAAADPHHIRSTLHAVVLGVAATGATSAQNRLRRRSGTALGSATPGPNWCRAAPPRLDADGVQCGRYRQRPAVVP